MHRHLGTHITKVKSVNLDKWSQEQVEIYQHMNNYLANHYFESSLNTKQKPTQSSGNAEVESFIKDKYVNRRWVNTKQNGNMHPAEIY